MCTRDLCIHSAGDRHLVHKETQRFSVSILLQACPRTLSTTNLGSFCLIQWFLSIPLMISWPPWQSGDRRVVHILCVLGLLGSRCRLSEHRFKSLHAITLYCGWLSISFHGRFPRNTSFPLFLHGWSEVATMQALSPLAAVLHQGLSAAGKRRR